MIDHQIDHLGAFFKITIIHHKRYSHLISQFFIISFTNPSSKTLPSYFSWSFTTTPMILELFLASRMPAIFGMYPEFSSSCWTRFTVSSEIFSVLYHSNSFFSVSLIIWYNKSMCFTKVKRVTHHKIRGSFLLYFTKYYAFKFASSHAETHKPLIPPGKTF